MTVSTSTSESLIVIEVTPKVFVSLDNIREWCPTVDEAIFFAKVMGMGYAQLSDLLFKLFKTDVVQALMSGNHSTVLQDYVVSVVPDDVLEQLDGVGYTDENPAPDTELLAQLVAGAKIEVAKSIQEVGRKLGSALSKMPGKQGRMTFQSMAVMNKRRPTVGDYRAVVQHERVEDVLVILDDSGSVSPDTVHAIIGEVVGLAWMHNAHLCLVSNTARHWQPGSYTVPDVLAKGEYGGTYYETLCPLLERDWGTVIAIADYDSSYSAQRAIARCKGRIGQLFDVSLVGRPTFLSECLAPLAEKVTPIMLGQRLINTRW